MSTSSDYARKHSPLFAMLACAGAITTELPQDRGAYGRMWRVTALGLTWLEAER